MKIIRVILLFIVGVTIVILECCLLRVPKSAGAPIEYLQKVKYQHTNAIKPARPKMEPYIHVEAMNTIVSLGVSSSNRSWVAWNNELRAQILLKSHFPLVTCFLQCNNTIILYFYNVIIL